jgi:AraC-like DNA-binding protein
MELEPTLSPRFIVYIRNYLMDRGIAPQAIFDECGIPYDDVEEYAYPIPLHKVANLFEAAVQHSNNTCMGLNMAQQFHYESASVIILAMLAAPSVEEGLNCLCRYDQFVDTGIEVRFNPRLDPVQFSPALINLSNAPEGQLNEYLMGFVVQILNTATRQRMPVVDVWFRHDCDQNAAALEQHFNCRVQFGQAENCLFFKQDFLQERFLTSNNLLYEILTDALRTYFSAGPEGHGMIEAVYREILRLGGAESPSLESVAAGLALSPRTLRRRLSDEGLSFQEVKSMARERRAKYYLSSTNLSLSEIAYELGYSELSAFSRAFRSWVGETPQAYRDKLKHLMRA